MKTIIVKFPSGPSCIDYIYMVYIMVHEAYIFIYTHTYTFILNKNVKEMTLVLGEDVMMNNRC